MPDNLLTFPPAQHWRLRMYHRYIHQLSARRPLNGPDREYIETLIRMWSDLEQEFQAELDQATLAVLPSSSRDFKRSDSARRFIRKAAQTCVTLLAATMWLYTSGVTGSSTDSASTGKDRRSCSPGILYTLSHQEETRQ